MSFNLQNHILSILNRQSSEGFLGLRVLSNFNETISENNNVLELATRLAKLFLLSDLTLYAGVVFVIVVLGYRYGSITKPFLTKRLVKTSAVFLYISLLLNIFGIFLGFRFISAFNIVLFDSSYTFSLFSQLAKVLLLTIVGVLYALLASVYKSKMQTLELPVLMQVSVALCATIISSSNFALLLLALEGFSLTLYVMTALGRTYGGVTASVKYFAFGTLGSIFLFWGAVHIYALVPSLGFETTNFMLQAVIAENSNFCSALEFATTALTVGFMFKLGAAPTHQWVSDVYAGSHMYVTAFFSTFVKFVLFMVFARVAVYFNSDSLVKFFIFASLIIGCVMSVRQAELKRLLAYSSIVHVAFLLMGDSTASTIYLLTYMCSALLLFSVLLTTEAAGKEIIYLSDLRLIRGTSYFQVFCFAIALASSAGLPPFAGFYGKFLV
jgi:NADH-quinone oxidoreductase subunit N